MTHGEWIVCESTSRWASALRMALQRQAAIDGRETRLYETRYLDDLAARLHEEPENFATIEVRESNVGDVLAWLARAAGHFPRARFAALLDRSLSQQQTNRASDAGDNLLDVCDALCEAGSLEIAHSPRHLQAVVELGRRHVACRHTATPVEADCEARVWASLPWQAETGQVG